MGILGRRHSGIRSRSSMAETGRRSEAPAPFSDSAATGPLPRVRRVLVMMLMGESGMEVVCDNTEGGSVVLMHRSNAFALTDDHDDASREFKPRPLQGREDGHCGAFLAWHRSLDPYSSRAGLATVRATVAVERSGDGSVQGLAHSEWRRDGHQRRTFGWEWDARSSRDTAVHGREVGGWGVEVRIAGSDANGQSAVLRGLRRVIVSQNTADIDEILIVHHVEKNSTPSWFC
ncbi:hypothetical protein B0T18DRAFT_389723 [Schizothecium vesticola]|uniref:Uncharacterized protein n=1 Tax=Schizothecium vesticola TaxID=314040 RepID=A0AA40K900_9PEZI|nr:hypothetical protein B0T18DRAFT_389723 [Schizothecium vesticola]